MHLGRIEEDCHMIARAWHGVTTEIRADEYHQYLMETGVPELQGTPGNKGVFVLREVHDGRAEFLLISLWDSWEAIRQFAGDRCPGRDITQRRRVPF